MFEDAIDTELRINTLETAKNETTKNLQTNRIQLAGSVEYLGQCMPIDICVSLYQGTINDNYIIGIPEDTGGIFETIFFAVILSAEEDNLFVNKSLATENVLQLILLKKETRELSVFEIPLNTLSATNFSIESLSPLDEASAEHWWVKIFTPEPAITPMVAGYVDRRTFTYSDGGAVQYKYEITLEANSSIYSFGTGNQVTDQYAFQVNSQRFYSGGKWYNTSYLFVHHITATAVLNSTTGANKDHIRNVHWNDNGIPSPNGWSGEITANLAASIGKFVSASVGISYTLWPAVTYNSIHTQQFNTQSIQAFRLPYQVQLKTPGHVISIEVRKEKNTVSTGTKVSGCNFKYSIGLSDYHYFAKNLVLTTSATYT